MAIVRTSPNVSVTFLESEGYHCDHGHTLGGDAKRNTSFRVECGLEGDFLPAPPNSRRSPSLNVTSHHFTHVSPATRLPTTLSVVKGHIFSDVFVPVLRILRCARMWMTASREIAATRVFAGICAILLEMTPSITMCTNTWCQRWPCTLRQHHRWSTSRQRLL